MGKLNIRGRVEFLRAVWRDPRTPWYAKAVLGATVAYAVSPIDLIPDFIPVLGQLDDLVIVPLGILLTYALVPRVVWEEHRRRFTSGGPGQGADGVAGRSANAPGSQAQSRQQGECGKEPQ